MHLLRSSPPGSQSALWPSLSAGLVLGVIGVLTYLTPMAALVFSGPLEPYLALGIGLTLFSAAVVGLVVALQSSCLGTIALPVPEEMAILAAISTAIAAQMPTTAAPVDLLVTVLGAIALTSILTGVFLFGLGQCRLGELIRFMPYPVVGGFLAGLGCLLSRGALKVMTDLDVGALSLTAFLQLDVLIRWLPGGLLAVGLLLMSRRSSHFLIMPVSFVLATGLFYGVWLATGHTLDQASTAGWLLGPFPDGNTWHPLGLWTLGKIHWSVIGSQIGSMVSMMLITALSLLMVSSGVELATAQSLNLNQELRATGLGCLLAGMLGGMVGSHTILTILSYKMKARTRLVGVVAALVYGMVLLAGMSVISFFPRPVLGGLLLYLGLDLLTQWLIEAWPKLPALDYAILVLIMTMIATIGFVPGVILGLVVATGLFVLTYSQIDVAKHTLSGRDFSSHVQRSITQTRLLRQQGDQIYVLQLQGLLFFGTAHTLLNRIRTRLHHPQLAPLQFLVLDFRRVNGLDSSAVLSFVKLRQILQPEQVQLVLTGLSSHLEQQLVRGGALTIPASPNCHQFISLDQGMEWCEEEILQQSRFRRRRVVPMAMQLELLLADVGLDSEATSVIMGYLERVRYQAGEQLYGPDIPPDAVYLIESGQISTWAESGQLPEQRLQTAGPGALMGEVEFITGTPYSLTARIDQSTTLYRLSRDQFEQMAQLDPDGATTLRAFINTLLAEQLAQSRKEVEMLMG